MAGKTSKNSRASRGGVASKAVTTVTFPILTPLNSGRGAYVFNAVDGTNPRVVVGSEQWTTLIATLAAAGQAAKIEAELAAFAVRYPDNGWDKTLADLKAAGIL